MDEEVIGTVEPINPYSREDESLWLLAKGNRNRYFCVRCKRGQHSEGFDKPCNTDCECMCKTHYIGRDGKTKIPYGKKDHTKEFDDERIPPSREFLEVMEEIRKNKPEITEE